MVKSIGNSVGFSQYNLPPAMSGYVNYSTYTINNPLFVAQFDKYRTNFRQFTLELSSAASEDKTFLIEGLISNGEGRAKEIMTILNGTTTSTSTSTNYYSNVSITPLQDQDSGSVLSVNRLTGYVEFQHHATKATFYVSTGSTQNWSIKGAVWNTETILNKEDLALLYFNINASLTNQLGTMTLPYYLEIPIGRIQVWSNSVDPGEEDEIIFQIASRQLYT